MYERFGPDDAEFVEASPAPPPPADETDDQTVSRLLGALAAKFHLQELRTDDVILLAVLFLILRRDGDWDVLLIMAALWFLGLFDKSGDASVQKTAAVGQHKE